MYEEALQIAEKRREEKGKGERYTHLNAEFQRIARRDNKAFLSEQCKEIEENNRMGKTRVLFKKIGDIKGTCHARIDTIKDRNGKALQKQNRLRRGGKNTQKNYTKKVLNGPYNHDGIVAHLELDMLEREVKWALRSITMNKVSDEIRAGL